MSAERPAGMRGLRHVALFVAAFEDCEHFYTNLVGMQVEWRPDPDNVYLTSGVDNLALHRSAESARGGQRLDHIGFILKAPEDVDAWYAYLRDAGVEMRTEPKTHRDGARSFYCLDPDQTLVQLIYHPPLAVV